MIWGVCRSFGTSQSLEGLLNSMRILSIAGEDDKPLLLQQLWRSNVVQERLDHAELGGNGSVSKLQGFIYKRPIFSSAGTGKNCALSLSLYEVVSPVLDKIVQPWVQKFYPVMGLGSGGRLLGHFQTPVLYWMHFGLRHIRRC